MDLARVINKLSEDFEWFFAVPETPKHIYWDEGMFSDIKRATLLPILPEGGERDKTEKDGFNGIVNPFFSPKLYAFFVTPFYRDMDVVLSSYYTANVIPSFQSEFQKGHWNLAPRPGLPTIINMMSITPKFPGLEHLLTPAGQRALASSVLGGDITITLNGEDYKEILTIARRFISASELERVIPKILFLRTAIDIDKIPKPNRPVNRANFFHAGTIVPWRHLEDIADMVKRPFIRGFPTKLILSTQHTQVPAWTEQRHIAVFSGVNRERLFNLFSEGDFAAVAMEHTGTAITYYEQPISGMVPIWWKRPWNEGLYPPNYPFACSSMAKMGEAIFFCASNPKKAKEIGSPGVAWVRKELAINSHGRKWMSILESGRKMKVDSTWRRCEKHFIFQLMNDTMRGMGKKIMRKALIQGMIQNSKSFKSEKDLSGYAPYIKSMAEAIAYRAGKMVAWEE